MPQSSEPRQAAAPRAAHRSRKAPPRRRLVLLAATLAAVLTAGAAAVGTPAGASATATGGYGGPDLQRDLDAIHDAGTTGIQGRVVTEDGEHIVATSGVADLATREQVPADGHYRIGSNTKTFTATVVLQLAGERKLSLDDTVEEHLPGVVRGNGNDGRRITIRQLLQHTGGIPDYDGPLFGITDSDSLDRLTVDDVRKVNERSYTAEELVALALEQPPLFAPGTGWSYSNTGYLLAGMIIQEVTGNPWHEEVERRITKPLGLEHTLLPDSPGLPEPHAKGYFHIRSTEPLEDFTEAGTGLADGGLVSNTEDMDRFFRALLGGDLLEPALLTEMQATVPTGEGDRYGLGLERNPLPCGGGYWSHGGTSLGYISEEGFTEGGRSVVLSASSLSFDPEEDERQDETITRLIQHALCDAG